MKVVMALPPDLRFSCLVFDIAFHPSQDVIAAGLVSGTIQLYVREELREGVLYRNFWLAVAASAVFGTSDARAQLLFYPQSLAASSMDRVFVRRLCLCRCTRKR